MKNLAKNPWFWCVVVIVLLALLGVYFQITL